MIQALHDEPLVSILTLSYNYDQFIGKTIESVLNQTYKNIQYIIVDDGSSDNSASVVKSYQDPRIEFYPLSKNVGATAAYAVGYSKARGDFFCSIDADDIIFPEKTSKQIACFVERPELDVLCTYTEVIDKQGARVPQPNPSEQWVNQLRDLNDPANWIAQNYVVHSSVMMRRRAHDDVGVLDPDMSAAPDYEHFLRFVAKGYKFHTLPEPLLQYRIHGDNITHKAPDKTFVEMLYAFWRHLSPRLTERRRFSEIAARLHQAATSEQFARLSFDARMRLLAVIASPPERVGSFAEFQKAWREASPYTGMMLESVLEYSPTAMEFRSMIANLGAAQGGLEWWRSQTESHARVAEYYNRRYSESRSRIADFLKQEMDIGDG